MGTAIEQKRNWYLYRHVRNDTNKPFYIGIGQKPNYERAKDFTKRSKYWLKIFNKCNGDIFYEILLENLSKEEAEIKEIEFITLYGRSVVDSKGTLCNIQGGGHLGGCFFFTEEHKSKLSKSLKGRTYSDETKLKMSIAKKGKPSHRKGVKLSPETIEKIKYNRSLQTGLKDPRKIQLSSGVEEEIYRLRIENKYGRRKIGSILNITSGIVQRVLREKGIKC